MIDEDGSVLSDLLSRLSSIDSLQTLVLTGHEFHSLVIPAQMPESLSTLVIDGEGRVRGVMVRLYSK